MSADLRLDFARRVAEIKSKITLSELIGRRVVLKRKGREYVGLCLFHNEKTPSFWVNDQKGVFNCFGCGAGGDAIEFVMRTDKLSSRWEALERLENDAGLQVAPRPAAEHRQPGTGQDERRRWSPEAEAEWRHCLPLTEARVPYPRLRNGSYPAGDDVRYSPARWHWQARAYYPAILSRITNFRTGEPQSLHFTFLDRHNTIKAPVEKAKLLLPGHEAKGGVIRLTDDADVTTRLGLAEGIETALCITKGLGASAMWLPVWSTISSTNMRGLAVLPGVEQLTIFADADEHGTGMNAARELAERWHEAGREVHIVKSPGVGTDWNAFRRECSA